VHTLYLDFLVVITLFGGFGTLKIVGTAFHFNLIQPSILFFQIGFPQNEPGI